MRTENYMSAEFLKLSTFRNHPLSKFPFNSATTSFIILHIQAATGNFHFQVSTPRLSSLSAH
jgi:hypothetical protein